MEKGPGNWTGDKIPRIRTRDIVIWLWRTSPERFTANEIAKKYTIARGDAHRRVLYMVTYGFARRLGEIETHEAGRRQVAYALTDWGKRYGSDQSKRKTWTDEGDSEAQAGDDALTFSHPDFGELNLKEFLFSVGHACFRAIQTSQHIEHENLGGTIDYLKEIGSNEERAAIRFLKAFVTLKTKTIMSDWHGVTGKLGSTKKAGFGSKRNPTEGK